MKNLLAVLTVALMCSWTVGCGPKEKPAEKPATPAPAQPDEKKEEAAKPADAAPADKPAEAAPAEKPEGGSETK